MRGLRLLSSGTLGMVKVFSHSSLCRARNISTLTAYDRRKLPRCINIP